MRYPSEPIISTPSYPAHFAKNADWAISEICFSIPSSSNSLGVKGEIGAFTELGATALSLYAYLPACKICITIFPPSL